MKCWQPDFFVFLQNTNQTILTISFSNIMETPKLIPARNFGPGYFIREQMEYRNMSIDKLAKVLKVTDEQLNKALDNKQPLSIEMAYALANVFETSTQYWLNLDLNYRKQIPTNLR